MAMITLQQFESLDSQEKVTALESDFLEGYQTLSDIIPIYNRALVDESIEVRRRAADMSWYLTPFLQELKKPELAKEYVEADFVYPEFSKKDTDLYQLNLLKALESNDDRWRGSAFIALVYSCPPDETLERFFFEKVSNEPKTIPKGEMIDAMVMAGYKSDQFVTMLVHLLSPQNEENLVRPASQALATIKPKSALPLLIKWIDEPKAPQQEILWTLASYGADAGDAKEVLVKLINDLMQEDDIILTARDTLMAILDDKPNQEYGHQVMEMNLLWPVNFPLEQLDGKGVKVNK